MPQRRPAPAAPTPCPASLAAPEQPAELLLYRLAKLTACAGRLVTRLCERGHGITRREWGMLMWLAREPGLPPSLLAQRLELDRARVSRGLASLQTKGLVQRTAGTGPRAQAALVLTEAGQQLHTRLWPQVRAINMQLAAALAPDQVQALDQALAALQQQALALELQAAPAAPAYPTRSQGSRHVAAREVDTTPASRLPGPAEVHGLRKR